MDKKTNFIKFVQFWGFLFLLGTGIAFVIIDATYSYRYFRLQAEQVRSVYIDNQKQIIKQEVARAVEMIRYQISKSEELTRKKIKSRVYEAYTIARNIYQQNKDTETKAKIKQMILDSLRPIRFENGSGYYFATRFDGVEILFADKPEMEGLNLLDMKDTRGQYVVKDMIEIVKRSGEGFYEYHWTKPRSSGNDFKKISFVKKFEPWDWFIGTGLYVDDIEKEIKLELLSVISRIRFGKEGYIFVNKLNGDALVSNGKLFPGDQKLWEVFNNNPGKMKDIFEKEYQAALKPEGDYIYYSHIKLTDPEAESPKVSFIFGLPEFQWLVGAGVYLDDVETNIGMMQAQLNYQMKMKILYFTLTVIVFLGLLLLFFNWLNIRLKSDLNLFISFFRRAANTDEAINQRGIKFAELDQVAEYANKMLSDRKTATDALRENEEKLRLFIEHAPASLVMFDRDMRHISISRRWMDDYGLVDRDVIGRTPYEVFSGFPDRWKEAHQRCLRGDVIEREEDTFVRADGTVQYLFWKMHPWFNADGNVGGTVIFSEDITGRKHAEEERAINMQRIQALLQLNQMTEATLPEITDFALNEAVRLTQSKIGYLAFLNEDESILTMHSWSKSAMEECAIEDKPIHYPVVDTGLWGEAVRQRRPVITNDYTASNPWKKGVPPGHVPLLRHMNAPIFNGDKIVAIVGVGNKETEYTETDGYQISLLVQGMWRLIEKKGEEEEREKLQAQLAQAQKMEAIGTLSGGIAHDFNNLLQVISGTTEVLLARTEEQHPHFARLKDIQKVTDRAAELVHQLLLFSRKAESHRRPLNLNQEIEQAARILERTILRMIRLEIQPGDSLYTVLADPIQMEQIVLNLGANAADAMPDGGVLMIETQNITLDERFTASHIGLQPGRYVLMSFTDTGHGMDRETMEKIFEPFFTTKEFGKGTGLGLATVYGIVKNCNGHISCYSEIDRGTTFRIYLPAIDEVDFQEVLPPRTPPNLHGFETILIVDDEKSIRDLARETLKEFGYSVMTASSGEEALDIFSRRSREIHLVVLDIGMPGMGGHLCLQELLQINPAVKVLIASGYSINGQVRKSIESGAKGFVGKPYQLLDLLDKLRAVLDGED